MKYSNGMKIEYTTSQGNKRVIEPESLEKQSGGYVLSIEADGKVYEWQVWSDCNDIHVLQKSGSSRKVGDSAKFI